MNLQDRESGWTGLHRALYSGNLVGARLLLQRGDCEVGIKDAEGMFFCSLGVQVGSDGRKLMISCLVWVFRE